MAVLASIATGNFTAAATWGVVNAASYLNSENATESLLTTAYSGTRSTAFTPGAITVSHIGVKLCERIGTTGTMSVSLRNATIGLDDFVTGTEVTINTADLPSCLEVDLNGGWVFFKLTAPVLLLAATTYNVQAKTSSATQVDLWCDATADNLSRCLVTTTTGAPAAGDDLIVAGEYTGTGTSNTFTVTMDQTATTDYGAASNSIVTPALAICSKGVLTWGTSAATNYNLKISGNLIIYSGGIMNMGTVATPCPRGSTMTLNFDVTVNVEYGLVIRNLGTLVAQGLSRTSGKDIHYCKLNTDEAAAQTVLGVDTDTGWLNGDEIGIASTTRTASQTERRTLSGDAGASSITVTAGLTNAHSGTSPTQAEVILITRSVKICGASATLQAYIDKKPLANFDCDWVEFYFLGSATALKRGISISTTTGSCSLRYCSFRDFSVTGSGINAAGATGDNYTIQHCVFYGVLSPFSNVATSGTSWVLDNLIAMGGSGAALAFGFLDVGGTITNITAAGNANTFDIISLVEANATLGTVNNLTAHSNGGSGISFAGFIDGTITNLTSWRNNTGSGLELINLQNVTVDGVTLFGNSTTNITLDGETRLTVLNAVSSGDTTFSTTSGIAYTAGGGGNVLIADSTFGVVSGIKTAHTQDITVIAGHFLNVVLHNTLLASTTEVTNQTNLGTGITIGSQKHDQTAGLHKTWKREGTITIETTAGLFDVTPSVRLTPLSATQKLESSPFSSAVTNGNTLTVSVKVRESVVGDGTEYNGNRIRLIVKRNIAAGITSDTVLATATVSSVGAFETISGTTAAVTDDAILEFVVDCDGTTGWVNYDTFTVSSQVDTRGLKYWKDGQPVAYGDNATGGGGTATVGYAYVA